MSQAQQASSAPDFIPADTPDFIPAEEQKPKKEGFLHSLGSVFGYTPEKYEEAKQRTSGMSPLREAWETVKPPNPLGVARNIGGAAKREFSKGSEEGAESYDALKRGDVKGALAHQIGQVGYAGATLGTPIFGNNLSKAGEQFGEGNLRGGLGTTAGVVAPALLPEVPGAMRKTGAGLERAAPYVGRGAKEAARFGGIGEFIHSGNPAALAGPVVAPLAERAAAGLTRGAGRLIRRTGEAFQPKPMMQGMAAGPGIASEAPVAAPVTTRPPVNQEAPVHSTWPPERPSAIQPRQFGGKADILETKGIQEKMREDLEGHGRQAYSQNKKDWFARNVPGKTKGELTARPGEVGVPGENLRPTASGESPASQEAINRVSSEKTQGVKRFRIDTRSGKETPLFGVDAVDAKAGPYDRIIKRGPNGEETVDEGPKARPVASTPRVAKTDQEREDLLMRSIQRARRSKAGD